MAYNNCDKPTSREPKTLFFLPGFPPKLDCRLIWQIKNAQNMEICFFSEPNHQQKDGGSMNSWKDPQDFPMFVSSMGSLFKHPPNNIGESQTGILSVS